MTMFPRAYGAHGESVGAVHIARLAFAGELREVETGWYLLGDRLYSPVLRRFLAPDPESPFHDGGLNRYVYCSGDPVNRIDPTGNAWTDWLMAGLGVGLAVLGTVFSVTAIARTIRVAGGIVAAAAPGIVATATAATLDVVATAASVGSVAAMATNNQQANRILGWVGLGAGIGSATAVISAARQGAFGMARGTSQVASATKAARSASAASAASASSAGARTASSASARISTVGKVASLVAVTRTALSSVPSSASARVQRRPTTASLVTPDANTSRPQLRGALSDMGTQGARAATLYTGPQRSSQAARNPNARMERTRSGLYREDLTGAQQAAASSAVKIDTTDVTTLSKEQLRRQLSDDDVHVVTGGHGLVDEVVTEGLNMRSPVAHHLLPVRGGL